MRARHERSRGGQLSLFSFERRGEYAPGAGLNAMLDDWMISASRRNSQRGTNEVPTRGDTVDKQANRESHPTLNVKPMQLPVQDIGDG